MLRTTFGGNPSVCAAAIATINVILEERLCERARIVGDIFLAKLESIIKLYTPHITLDTRGKGLMSEFEFAGTDIDFRVSKGLFRDKILVAGTFSGVTRNSSVPGQCPTTFSKSDDYS